ncbi:uncharacterized protein DS421_16g550530 [Arachis hypogaea]|nr:uncharacterized protein DS421_16g550530 [Arachis hypogaea]
MEAGEQRQQRNGGPREAATAKVEESSCECEIIVGKEEKEGIKLKRRRGRGMISSWGSRRGRVGGGKGVGLGMEKEKVKVGGGRRVGDGDREGNILEIGRGGVLRWITLRLECKFKSYFKT